MGNPIRQDITQIECSKHTEASRPLRLLIVGGSLGARVFNQTLPLCQKALEQPIEIWHQTGRGQAQSVREAYQNPDEHLVRIEDFIDDMASAYNWADIVLCRAGALTVSELIAAKKPAILIPYPHAVDDHQTKNAQFIATQGGAVLLPESEFTVEKITALLHELQTQDQILSKMHTALAAMVQPNATEQVASICEDEYQQGK